MASQRDLTTPQLQFPEYGKVLLLKDLVDKFSSSMPFQYRIMKGFLSEKNNKDPTFGANEVYTAHLLVQRDVARITSADGEFRVPLNSSFKFGLIHDEQIECMSFDDVDELMFAKPFPKVVAVKNDCIFPEVALKKNEVLIIKDVVRAKVGKQRIAIKFFSLLQEKEIILYKEQEIPFTTNPRRTQLSLRDLVKHLGWDCMPCLAKVFSEDTSSTLQSLLTSTTINLVGRDTNQSVIVSRYQKHSEAGSARAFNFISIPAQLDISMSVIVPEVSSEVYKGMVEQTMDLIRHYTPSRICLCLNSETNEAYSIQEQFLSAIHVGEEWENLTQFAPPFICGLIGKEKKSSVAESMIVKVPSPSPNELSASLPTSNLRILSPDPPTKGYKSTRSSYGDDSDDSYVIPPFLPAKTVLSSQDSVYKATSYGSSTSSSPVEESRLYSATQLKNVETTVLGKKLPVPPKSNNADPDYDEIEDYPVKSSGVLQARISAESALRFTYSSSSKKKHISKQSSSQEATPTSCQPYVKFLPNSSSLDFGSDREVRMHAMMRQLEDLHKKLADLTVTVNDMMLWKKDISSDLENLKNSHVKSVRNRQVISKDMSPEEVAGVLEAIGLPQYKEAFRREVIDGVTFMGLDDTTLERELQVPSKIHRLRILKLMEGNN